MASKLRGARHGTLSSKRMCPEWRFRRGKQGPRATAEEHVVHVPKVDASIGLEDAMEEIAMLKATLEQERQQARLLQEAERQRQKLLQDMELLRQDLAKLVADKEDEKRAKEEAPSTPTASKCSSSPTSPSWPEAPSDPSSPDSAQAKLSHARMADEAKAREENSRAVLLDNQTLQQKVREMELERSVFLEVQAKSEEDRKALIARIRQAEEDKAREIESALNSRRDQWKEAAMRRETQQLRASTATHNKNPKTAENLLKEFEEWKECSSRSNSRSEPGEVMVSFLLPAFGEVEEDQAKLEGLLPCSEVGEKIANPFPKASAVPPVDFDNLDHQVTVEDWCRERAKIAKKQRRLRRANHGIRVAWGLDTDCDDE